MNSDQRQLMFRKEVVDAEQTDTPTLVQATTIVSS
jgi:hypothetical protein